MGSLPGILFFVLGLLVSVGIHELGHLIPAKKFGAQVSQYFIGFGPTLWSTRRGVTEYGVKAIPLGGYVRIAGMFAPARPGTHTHKANGEPTIAEQARMESREELAPGEENQAMWRLSPWRRILVMFGGPATNFVLALICFGVAMGGIGTQTPSATVGRVLACAHEPCTHASVPTPASQAGFFAGDRIISWGEVPVATWTDVQRAIASGGTEPVQVRIVREGSERVLTLTPTTVELPIYDEAGRAVVKEDGSAATVEKPYAGIAPAYVRQRQNVSTIISQVRTMSKATAGIIWRLPSELWNTATTLVTGEARPATGVVGIVGVADLAGSITAASTPNYTALDRLADLLLLMGSLNLSLFLFNLIPLLPLDGGHIVGALWEGIRRGTARLRGKEDPGPVDMARAVPLSWIVGSLFVGMAILLIIADLLNPVFSQGV